MGRFWILVVAVAATMLVLVGVDEASAEVEYASWYGPGFDGQLTCSGDVFYSGEYTAASLEYEQGTVLRVFYGGTYVDVVVNDCGPYVYGRTLDLSQAAAEAIGLTWAGVDHVEAYPVGYAY